MEFAHDAGYQIIIAIRRIIRGIEIHSKRLEREYGLTVPQLLILEEIGAKRNVSARRLAKVLSTSQATITPIIDRLEQHGFVERIRSTEDKRVVFVRATSRTMELLGGKPSVLQEHFKERLDELEEWEKTLILSSIQRVASMMESGELKGNPLLEDDSDDLFE